MLVALGGADGLKQLELPGPVTIFGIIPLTVLFIRRWSPSAGLWKLLAQMIPYWAGFTLIWIPLLLAWWALGLPLGLNAPYVYPAP